MKTKTTTVTLEIHWIMALLMAVDVALTLAFLARPDYALAALAGALLVVKVLESIQVSESYADSEE